MRLFVCTLLSRANQRFYSQSIGAVIEAHRDILRPIPPGSAHLTIAFLPRVDPSFVDPLCEVLAGVTASHRPVTIDLGIPFILTAGSEARLICAGVENGVQPLTTLMADATAGLVPLEQRGLEIRATKSLHVTLARFRKGTRRRETHAVDAALRQHVDTRAETVTAVQLMTSVLTPRGPVYDTVQAWTLAGA